MSEVLQMAIRTTAGQSLELRWRRDNALDLQPEDYFHLILQKTCCYTTMYPLRIGALIGSRGALDDDALEPITQFGYYLGAAFQIRDDLLNLVGAPATYGKEALGDLREGKRTLMLIHLLQAADPRDRAWLAAYLDRPISGRRPDESATPYRTSRVAALLRGRSRRRQERGSRRPPRPDRESRRWAY